MEREPPPVVTVTTPGDGQATGDLLASDRPPRPPRPPLPRRVRLLALAGAAVLAGGLVLAQDAREPGPVGDRPPPVPPSPASAADGGLTATATLSGARTDEPYVQRLTLTVVLEPYDGRSDSGARLLGDEVALHEVRVRGFAVQPDDRRTPIPLGRFGRARVGRATTVSLAAAVADCALESQARRDVEVRVRTGEGPVEVLRAAVQPELVRALDRVFSRSCRRPRA